MEFCIVSMNKKNNLPQPTIGVSGLVFNDQGQILLIKRNQPPASGLWSLPGGRLEPGETLVSACCREVMEETGIDIEVKHMVAVVERQIEHFHYLIVDFYAELLPNSKVEPVANTDVSEAKWVSLEDARALSLVDGLEAIIERSFDYYMAGSVAGLFDANGDHSDYILPVFQG